jgi:hypothetical protein
MVGEVENVQQFGLCRIACGPMRGASNKPVLNKFDHRGMVRWNMGIIVSPNEW